jgi:hypothetical protein
MGIFRAGSDVFEPPVPWVPEGDPDLRIKRPGRQTDHSGPSSAKVKNKRIRSSTTSTSAVHYGLRVWGEWKVVKKELKIKEIN